MTDKIETPWSTIGYITYKRTYSRRLDDSDTDSPTEEFEDTINRVIEGTDTQLKVGFTEDEKNRLRSYMLQLKGTVAGRFLWQLGTPMIDRLGLASLQNCFGRETKFVTDEGLKSFFDFDDGDSVTVRGRKWWKPAIVKNFGKANLSTLTLRRGRRLETIRTTLNHRWLLADGSVVTTSELKENDVLQKMESRLVLKDLRMCPVGRQHGIVYGDGHHISNGTSTAWCKVGDYNKELEAFFVSTDASMVSGLPYFYKTLPDLKEANTHYLWGFLAGWFAADGSIGKNGSNITLTNKDEKVLEWARGAFYKLGITTSDVSLARELSPYDGTKKPLYRISIDRENLPESFFILSKHKGRFQDQLEKRKWKVVSISDEGDEEDVWCVVEPENEEFTLACGVLTKNCAFTTVDEPVKPFTWAFDMLMLGSGVGYNIQKKHVDKLPVVKEDFKTPHREDTDDAQFIVPDSREGWVSLLGKTLKAAFLAHETGRQTFTYSTKLIRSKGAPIKGFGGTASGPEDLVWGINQIGRILEKRAGRKLRPIDCLDIMNIIGAVVVAGNVRRSAQLAIGDPDDVEFLLAKRWDMGNIPSWRAMSNNSVACNDFKDLHEYFWDGYEGKGEPYGLINLRLSRKVGRLGDTDYPDPKVEGYNPCAEQSLASKETCCLAEVYLPNIDTYEELLDVVKLLYRVNKHSLALGCHHKSTEDIVNANMRMGIGITGFLQATEEQKSWLSSAYTELRTYDKEYSALKGFPESIKLTTVKPSGTLSLLPGVTPGAHPGYAQYMIRRIRMSSGHALVETCREHGYKIEYQRNFDGSEDHSTVVVEFPFAYPEHTKLASEMTAVDQLETIKWLQENWSDNSVSCTVYYRKEELSDIQAYLKKNYKKNHKSLSFLLHSGHGFDQAPFEEITKERYDEIVANTRLITKLDNADIGLDDSECAGGACPIR